MQVAPAPFSVRAASETPVVVEVIECRYATTAGGGAAQQESRNFGVPFEAKCYFRWVRRGLERDPRNLHEAADVFTRLRQRRGHVIRAGIA